MKLLARLILWIFGWKVKGKFDESNKNCIIIVAPHTSQWDFVWGLLARTVYGIRAKYLIKNSFFKPGIGWFFKLTGGIPVDRSKKNDLTDRLKLMLKSGRGLIVVFTPEGTRQRVDKWRTGFYWTAIDTGLPIYMHYIDYAKKEVGQSEAFIPTGDWEKDRLIIQAYYAGVTPKHEAGFNRVI